MGHLLEKDHDVNFVHFAPPAIARHERAGHNWNVGILERWNNGFWENGKLNLVGGSRIGYPLPTERLVPAR